VLVDVRDRPQAQVSYVPQEAVELVTPAEAVATAGTEDEKEDEGSEESVVDAAAASSPADGARLVLHPLLGRHFASYALAAGHFVPGAALAAAFPADTPAAVPTSAAVRRATDDSLAATCVARAARAQRLRLRLPLLSAAAGLDGSSEAADRSVGSGSDTDDEAKAGGRVTV